MEIDLIQSNNGFGRLVSTKLGQTHNMDKQNPDEEEGANKWSATARGCGGIDLCGGGVGRFHGWPSSRIVRVSRASGGKDRHSKVLTSKGLRDRRVRLSVNTAIQFYDLQERLGVDQPSKAVEWLLKAADASITDLPPMDSPFLDSGEVDMDGGDPSHIRQRQQTKASVCSSNSETSKGSGLSLSRSENWIEPDKMEKENESSHVASFTELLSRGINTINNGHNGRSAHQNPNWRAGGGGGGSNSTHWSSDYFNSGLLGQMQFPNLPKSAAAADHQHHQADQFQHFAFAPPAGENGGNNSERNLNFTISYANNSSSGVAAFNRGTLQSNSSPPSLLPHETQRFNHPADGSSPSFFIGGGAAANHHHFLSGFDAGLQLYYGSDAESNKGKLEKK